MLQYTNLRSCSLAIQLVYGFDTAKLVAGEKLLMSSKDKEMLIGASQFKMA